MITDLETFERDCWKVHPTLNIPGKFPPAVIFALLDSDPRPKFSEIQKQGADREVMLQGNLKPPMTQPLLHETLLIAAWDRVFHETPGDRISLLFNRSRPDPLASSNDPDTGIEVMISSNERAEQKWLVTRATWYQGKAVCWCLPVNVLQGQKTEVELTLQNMVSLNLN